MKDSLLQNINNSLQKIAENGETVDFFGDYNFWFGLINLIGIFIVLITFFVNYVINPQSSFSLLNLEYNPEDEYDPAEPNKNNYKINIIISNPGRKPIVLNSVDFGFLNKKTKRIGSFSNGNRDGEIIEPGTSSKHSLLTSKNVQKIENNDSLGLKISFIDIKGKKAFYLFDISEFEKNDAKKKEYQITMREVSYFKKIKFKKIKNNSKNKSTIIKVENQHK